MYGTRFVDEIKNAGKPNAYEKSRLVVQAYGDKSHGLITYAPTIQRASQRLLFAICALDPTLTLSTRDVSQAYTHAGTKVQRDIFNRPPPELGRSRHRFGLKRIQNKIGALKAYWKKPERHRGPIVSFVFGDRIDADSIDYDWIRQDRAQMCNRARGD